MTKKEVIKLLAMIETVYSNCIFKAETIQKWFEYCSEMDFEKVMVKVKNHIRKSPFPPAIADIAVFPFEDNNFPETLQDWMKQGLEREPKSNRRGPLPGWLAEYSPRKSV